MKYLKLFESMSDKKVEKICKEYGIVNWSINKDGLVDVDGDVYLTSKGLTKLPLQFGRVTGNLYCLENHLTTLKGTPKEVGGHFDCSRNQLTTLEGAPKEVSGNFLCFHNNLTTLEGAPKEVGGNFFCFVNNLTTLEGGPQEVGGRFICSYNKLTTLKWAPEYVGEESSFLPNGNLPKEFINFLGLNDNRRVLQKYILKWQKDYAVWRKDGSFNKSNFIQMMQEAQDELQNLKFTE